MERVEEGWSGQAVAHPAIVHHPDGYWECGTAPTHKLGYAYSQNGIDWNRCVEPVLSGGTGDSWESHRRAVDVVFHNGWYLMAHTGGFAAHFESAGHEPRWTD